MGALLPRNSTATAVVDGYLEHVIEYSMSVSDKSGFSDSGRRTSSRTAGIRFLANKRPDNGHPDRRQGQRKLSVLAEVEMLIPSGRILAPLLLAGHT